MEHTLSLLMAQLNPLVGAIENNTKNIISIIEKNQQHHDLIIFPELVITGYPPEDLLLREELFDRVNYAIQKIQEKIQDCYVIIGYPHRVDGKCFNAAGIFHKGALIKIMHKQKLPNYGVFDEYRYFVPGDTAPCHIEINGYKLGLCICEDLWQTGPVEQLITEKVHAIISINASPFDVNKQQQRETLLRHTAHLGITMIYVNQVGGQDELVFDGQSCVIDGQGRVAARARAFAEDLQTVHIKGQEVFGTITPLLNEDALLYNALCCGLRDYINKNNFPGVLLGLSGGIDSALTMAIAVDALGASRVHAVMLPSQFTASMSNDDALQQIKSMNVTHSTLPIEPVFQALKKTLATIMDTTSQDNTAENLQARTRGILLMAISNKTGNMLLNTSNKSETAVGYTTLYGDMNGGFAVLKDVFKTTVYRLANYRNTISAVIPTRVLTRPPSAELSENQTDQDSLPDYAILDAILLGYIEHRLSANDLIQQGFNKDTVHKIIKLIIQNEYKRYQAAPGVKISQCTLGRCWRYPITSGFL